MSFVRRTVSTGPRSTATSGPGAAHVRQHRAIRSDRVCEGTLACAHCDAPVSPGEATLSLGDLLSCPFCGYAGPVRDFLSLAAPTRPARVIVRLSLPQRSATR
jgi:hypothetical protein